MQARTASVVESPGRQTVVAQEARQKVQKNAEGQASIAATTTNALQKTHKKVQKKAENQGLVSTAIESDGHPTTTTALKACKQLRKNVKVQKIDVVAEAHAPQRNVKARVPVTVVIDSDTAANVGAKSSKRKITTAQDNATAVKSKRARASASQREKLL